MDPRWYEDDSFWQDFAPVMFTRDRVEGTAGEVERLLRLVELDPPAAVLDLCCGPGRHAIELARRGFQVTGVDRTAAYLERARRGAAHAGLELELVQEDMRRFEREGAFDLAINIYTAFGYFEDPADDLETLVRAHASLRPGGRLVIDLMGKEVLARRFRERDWYELDDGTTVFEERRLLDSWGTVQTRWRLLRDGKVRAGAMTLRLYSAAELAALLRCAGFSEAQAFGSLDAAPYDDLADRLVMVATRSTAG